MLSIIHWCCLETLVLSPLPAAIPPPQCMLHWRYALNGNATVKGTGTWQPVEDERMLSLVQVRGGGGGMFIRCLP